MLITMFKSKVHRATVTQADLNYAGSLTLAKLAKSDVGHEERAAVSSSPDKGL